MTEKQVYTSYFANIRKLPDDVVPLGISIGKNKYIEGIEYDQRMAPTWPMLRMNQADYDKRMAAILNGLDAQKIYDSFPDKVALICYEKFNDRCHRRMVAEWLEAELGIIVPEYGLKREESFPYDETGPHNKGKKRNPDLIARKDAEQNTDTEEADKEPEAVRLRRESYKKENQEIDLFNFDDF